MLLLVDLQNDAMSIEINKAVWSAMLELDADGMQIVAYLSGGPIGITMTPPGFSCGARQA